MRLDEMVHAAGVIGELRAILGGHRNVSVLGDAAHTQTARLAIGFDSSGTHDLRQIAGGKAA
jgi:hypothetical protein